MCDINNIYMALTQKMLGNLSIAVYIWKKTYLRFYQKWAHTFFMREYKHYVQD